MDEVFKALADPTRRSILDRLHARGGQTLGELCAEVNMSRQAASKHIAVLERANLVVVEWRGREKLHYLNPMPIQEIHSRWIHKFELGRVTALSQLKHGLEDQKDKSNG